MCWRQLAHNLSSGSKHTYDAQNQLTKEEHYDGLGTGSSHITETYEYTYDTAGNILSEKVDGTVTKTYAYNDTYWGDKLTSFNGMTISYDGVGNPLLYVSGSDLCTLTWQHGRQLATAFVDNVMYRYDLTFSYDADGIRTSKDVDGTVHYYLTQNGKVVRETIGTGSTARVLDFIYDESGKPLAVRDSHDGGSTFATYYYVLNLQGDVVKLIGASGTVYANYKYNAWGELLSVTNASGNVITDYSHISHVNPLRYRGYYYDRETGWYYLQSRYYDPAMHRFINADTFASTGQGLLGCNMFAYCNNNPVNFADETGHMAGIRMWNNLMTDGKNNSFYTTRKDEVVYTAVQLQTLGSIKYKYYCRISILHTPISYNDNYVTVKDKINYSNYRENIRLFDVDNAEIYGHIVPFVNDYVSLFIRYENYRLRVDVQFLGESFAPVALPADHVAGMADELTGIFDAAGCMGAYIGFGPGSITPWILQPK